MSEERMRVLQMLSEGKIGVEEAARLLEALGEERAGGGAEAQKGRGRGGDWSAWEERFAREWEERFAREFDGLGEQARAQVEQARKTLSASMPHIKDMFAGMKRNFAEIFSEPEMEDMFAGMKRNFSEIFADWNLAGDEGRYTEGAERTVEQSEALAPGSRLVLHNPRGHIAVETWEREELGVRLHIEVRARSAEAAQRFAGAVRLEVERSPQALHLKPIVPESGEGEIGPWELNFKLQVPGKLEVDLRSSHGNIDLVRLEGHAVVGNRHGKIRLPEGMGGNLSIRQSHGEVCIGPVGGELALESTHGHVSLEGVGGRASVRVSHASLELGGVGEDAEIEIDHGRLDLSGVGGDTRVKLGHGPARIQRLKGQLALQASHAPVEICEVGGKVHAVASHGPLKICRVAGGLVAHNTHAPIEVEEVGGEALVKNAHAPVRLLRVREGATVENSHGPVHLKEVGGRAAVRSGRGPVHIEAPGGEVMVQNARAEIIVRPRGPVQAAYTLQNQRGNVEVVLPEGSAVEVQAYVSRGRIDTDLPLQVVANGKFGQMLSGSLEGGGAPLKVEVERGNLYLKTEQGSV